MGVHQKATDLTEVDIIIAGGGTAGCVLAGRLADTDPNLSVLIIEGGKNNYQEDNVVNPALFLEHLAPDSKTAIFYRGNKSANLAGREPIVPSGGILGGGSSINFLMYTRAQRSDFDSWKTPGWSAKEIQPLLNKLETYHGAGDAKDHGFNGPIHISDGGYRATEGERDFISAAKEVGYPEIKDLQNLEANNGVGRWMRTVSKDGKRQDAAHCYVHPLLQDGQHPNLHVLVESKVIRVLFDDNKKACGVEYTPNTDFQPEIGLTPHPKVQIKARKLVVVSCGACGTPPVLERSGVGSVDILKAAAVPLIANVPGIGNDYQDHNLIFMPYRTALAVHETNDAILSGRMNRDEAIANKEPILGWNSVDVAAKLRPTDSEVASLGSEFQAAWDKDFKNEPNKPLMLMALVSSYLGDQSTIPPGQYVSVADYTAYPYSRGSIHITGPTLADPLSFDVGFFSDANDIDLKKQIWAYKKQREIMRRTQMYRGELAIGHPKFPEGSKAACIELKDCGIANGSGKAIYDIEYSADDDKAIEQFLRENIATTWHSLGTCKMAPRQQLGVVDANLNVYGVSGLKVVDLSIAPENVGANTNNTALVIGEKGADIIIKELGLSVRGKSALALNANRPEKIFLRSRF